MMKYRFHYKKHFLEIRIYLATRKHFGVATWGIWPVILNHSMPFPGRYLLREHTRGVCPCCMLLSILFLALLGK